MNANFKLASCLLKSFFSLIFLWSTIISANQLEDSVSAIDPKLGQLVKNARLKMVQGDSETAYKLLLEQEIKGAGILGFDYLLGIAALESGHLSIAIMVLQRVIDSEPDFAGARFKLAQAYYKMGDNEQARYHFTRLQEKKLANKLSDLIDDYLRAIDRKSAKYKTRSSGFIGAGLGFDSNANASTDDAFFLNFPLNDENQKQSSAFYQVETGGHYSTPVSAQSQFHMDGQLSLRNNPSISLVDRTRVNFSFGYKMDWSGKILDFSLNSFYQLLDDSFNRYSNRLQISYLQPINENYNFKVSAGGGNQRFQDEVEVRDVNQLNATLGIERQSDNANNTLGFYLVYGEDDAITGVSPYSNQQFGFQVIGQRVLTENILLTAAIGTLNINYNGDIPFFGIDREDDQNIATIAVYWMDVPNKNWQLKANLSYIDKSSNVSLFDFNRTEIGLSLQKSFE